MGGKVNFGECRYISRETHDELIKRCNPEPGDLLVTKSGTIGRLAIVPDKEFSLFVSVALIKLQSAQNSIEPTWVKYAFQYHLMSLDVNQAVKGGVVKNYHLEDLRLVELPLCPFLEQVEVARLLDRECSIVEELDKTLAEQTERAVSLKQSILKRAFEGKLVPQDPNDEPASVLLERIRQEQADAPKPKRRKRKVGAST